MSKVPTEPQLEATFEVLAWLRQELDKPEVPRNLLHSVEDVRELLKEEVDRCLAE